MSIACLRLDFSDLTMLLPRNHNGGPPLEDEHEPEWGDGDACTYFQWKAALRRARRSPHHDITLFRLSRAEAAGVDYETYVTELIERGVRLQAGDDLAAIRNRWKSRPSRAATSLMRR